MVPRSLLVLYPMLLTIYMGGGRAAYRMWKEHRLYGGLIAQGKPVVIVGAGRGGAMLAREPSAARTGGWWPWWTTIAASGEGFPAIRSSAASRACPKCWPRKRLPT